MIKNYLRLVKFSHSVFSLPFALTSFFLAMHIYNLSFDIALLVKVVISVVFARNAAMGFNRYADRLFDAQNPRTKNREIPAGIIKPNAAFIFVVVNCLLFVFSAFLINNLCFMLSPLALLVIIGYSFTKRHTVICHFFLGLGLSLAPLGAWLAVAEEFHIIPIMLAAAVLLWVAGFDIIYALQDEGYDSSKKLYSIPAAIGRKRAMILSSIVHLFCFAFLIVVSRLSGFHYKGALGTLVFGLLLFYQHMIISPDDISKVNVSFFTTNGIASILWFGGVMADLYL